MRGIIDVIAFDLRMVEAWVSVTVLVMGCCSGPRTRLPKPSAADE